MLTNIGDRFGTLTVVGWEWKTRPTGTRYRIARCLCDCGREHLKETANLRRPTDNSRLCECQSHWSDHPTYVTWSSMMTRCYNPKTKNYADYGGRGITVCDEWRNDPKAFIDYVTRLPHHGEPGRSIDRIDNDRGYEPGNVRWATFSEQMRNRRTFGFERDSLSGVKGVYFNPRRPRSPWYVRVRPAPGSGEKYRSFGTYATKEEAIAALQAAQEHQVAA
jgi:hypothetical protein